jgi:peptidoglycan glycosyltransferase
MSLLFIFQAATNAQQSAPPLEKQPALLTLIYMGGLALMLVFLIISLFRNRSQRSALAAVAAADLPEEVVQRLGSTSTNRGLRFLRWFYILLALTVFGFHIYWAKYASEANERFQQLSYKDLRNRRLSDSTLRGWILDRSGQLDKALALYKRDGSGKITREYSMDQAMAHLFGSDRGDPGLERALFGLHSGAVPEAHEVVQGQSLKQQANFDVRLTIDRELQKTVVEQLKGRHGAAVVINPQTGEVLAMYSNPSYSLKEVQDETTWIRLDADKRDSPLVNRALGSYYIPGSTFKTMMMIGAMVSGEQNAQFLCSGSGYIAQPGAKPIFDDAGPGEVHGMIGMDKAYEVSCNQYFAQMAVHLGSERIKRTADLVGIGAYDTPSDPTQGRRQPEIWNASTDAVRRAIAPRQAWMVTGKVGKDLSKFDLALEGYGQGYAGQMTPFQMTLLAAVIGNMEGKLMKPKLEFDRPPEVYKQVLTAQGAQELRRIMGLVTTSGTARGVFGPVKAAGIESGGKTGTAQKVVPVYDPKTGEIKTRLKVERDPKGNIIRQYEENIMDYDNPRIDSWYLSIAPLDRPQIAIAVIIEGGGYGSRAAAPVAAQLVLKARELGLLGMKPQAAATETKKPAARNQPQPKKPQPFNTERN